MINLIPKEEKRKMVIDFYYRLAALLLLMASLTVFTASMAILPAYFLSLEKNSTANTKLEIQKQEPLPPLGEQSLAEGKNINNELDLVENAEKNKFIISEKIINATLLKKMPGIEITQILYQSDGAKNKKVSIAGVASSREVLLSFEQAFQEDPTFKNVDLPISNFVKESNIQFDLSFTPS